MCFLHHQPASLDGIRGLKYEHMWPCKFQKKKAVQQGQSSPSDMFCFQQKEKKREDKREKEKESEREQTTAASSISHYIEYSV